MRRFVFIVLCLSLVLCLIGTASAYPPGPPPAGKVWIEEGGQWILVIAPPGDGPYIWRGGAWIIDPTPPPHSEWTPGHWSSAGWVAGHWKVIAAPGPGAHWVDGHWKHGRWVPGHWAGSGPRGKAWVPGHRGPAGRWIPGHWR